MTTPIDDATEKRRRCHGPLKTDEVLVEEAFAIDPVDAKSKLPKELVESVIPEARHVSADAQGDAAHKEDHTPAQDARTRRLGVAGHSGDVADCVASAHRQHTLYQALNRLDRAALCLSGGGIRSAAFSLGVIQALATNPRPFKNREMFQARPAEHGTKKHDEKDQAKAPAAEAAAPRHAGDTATHRKFDEQGGDQKTVLNNTVKKSEESLLAELHFLSTVSGGGYIGSWLSAWSSRSTFDAVRNNLVGRPCGPDIEPNTFAWLRAYSNYLTPQLGALSGDTWAGVAIWLRNLLLNWLIILPGICVVILLLKMIAAASVGIAVLPDNSWTPVVYGVLAVILVVGALRFMTRNRPTRRVEDTRDKLGRPLGVDQGQFIRWQVVPATIAAGALIQLGASDVGLRLAGAHGKGFIIVWAAVLAALIYALSWIIACPERREWRDFRFWTWSGAVYGALLGAGLYVYKLAPDSGNLLFNDLLLPVMFGVPWILLSQMVAEMIFVGLSSLQRRPGASRERKTPGTSATSPGPDAPASQADGTQPAEPNAAPDAEEVGTQDDSDSDREWLGRASGWQLVVALGWLAVTFLIFAGSLVLTSLGPRIETWLAPLGGLGGVVTALLGKSQLSGGRGATAKGAMPISTGIILAIAAPLFAAALLLFLSAGLDKLLLADSLVVMLRFPDMQIFAPFWWQRLFALLLGIAIVGVIAYAVRAGLGRWRWWILAIIGPFVAIALVTLVQAVIDIGFHGSLAQLTIDPLSMLTRELCTTGWPILLGLIATVVLALYVAQYRELERWYIFIIVAPPAAALMTFLVTAVIQWLCPQVLPDPGLRIFSPTWFGIFGPLLIGLAIALAVTWIASRSININRFSLHAVYRNRLMRAFLGASRPQRNPDAFSGFDEDDNQAMSSLWWPKEPDGGWPRRDPKKWRPFHLINIALNVVSTRHLSWQERKAESFTVSALHSGSACKAYRRSDEYGGRKGISLGTAMAISGAAASPNMGYQSSPGITFLLALFNVRLGWWFGNPGEEGADTYQLPGPATALRPLIDETFGLTTDENPYVYLSDGGHFENLGLYEMVRRRCRYIIAVDAGQDGDYGFEDLGNAVRKIAIDLGITIRFHGLDKLKKRDPSCPILGKGLPYHAVGEIDYRAADGDRSQQGVILYIKPGYHGVENAGVCAYAIANPTFPHQSTIDQFFSESQFESYRALGFEITDGILYDALNAIADKPDHPTPVKLEHVFDYLCRTVSEPAPKPATKPVTDAHESG